MRPTSMTTSHDSVGAHEELVLCHCVEGELFRGYLVRRDHRE